MRPKPQLGLTDAERCYRDSPNARPRLDRGRAAAEVRGRRIGQFDERISKQSRHGECAHARHRGPGYRLFHNKPCSFTAGWPRPRVHRATFQRRSRPRTGPPTAHGAVEHGWQWHLEPTWRQQSVGPGPSGAGPVGTCASGPGRARGAAIEMTDRGVFCGDRTTDC
jgi:hypothetical protein